jgi:hypothetical protein
MKTNDLCREYTNKLDKVKLQFDSEVAELAKQFRDNVINPVCLNYNLRFEYGMGNYHFVDLATGSELITPEYVEDVLYDLDRDLDGDPVGVRGPYLMYEDLQAIFDVLEAKIFNDLFNYWF